MGKSSKLDKKIVEIGKDFFDAISDEKPSIFKKDWWIGKVMDWAMDNEHFKTQLFHFVDVLPCIESDQSLRRHVEEYFGGENQEVPPVLRWGVKHAGFGGKLTAKLLGYTLRKNIESMARQFIIGRNLDEAMATLHDLQEQGFNSTIDILGEATISEQEARKCQQDYHNLLDRLALDQQKGDGGIARVGDEIEWQMPTVNISVKPTSLYSQAHPVDFENSVAALYERFLPLLIRAKEIGAFIYIDMEQHLFKDLTLELYRRLRSSEAGRDYPYLGIVIQAYLYETDHDLEQLISWARTEELPIAIRLVKGAYWEYETIIAKQKGLTIPVYQNKAESDAAFERGTKKILENHDLCHFACASHNIRSIAATIAMARDFGVPEDRYEFQVLYGMAGPVRRALLQIAGRVRLYCPYGELLPGMGYLVRRLLENTANESFLRQSFVDQRDVEELLADPCLLLENLDGKDRAQEVFEEVDTDSTYFRNEPAPDFTSVHLRNEFKQQLQRVKQQCGMKIPMLINGKEVVGEDSLDSINPANPVQVVGRVSQAGKKEIDQAIAASVKVIDLWRKTDPGERAVYLRQAAGIMRKKLIELACWQIVEVGKQWEQAYMDVAEAIDFFEYYAEQIVCLAEGRQIKNPLGEDNTYKYRGKGIAAVIAPWNFPMAIGCGMCTAALAAGNCVIFKPSGLTPVIGYKLAEVFKEVGLPEGVFHFVPGRGEVVGDYLVTHPQVNIIAFTGSSEVGLGIVEKTAKVCKEQQYVKKVIAEMGGKNAVIVDDDADLDQAVPQILLSAFGFQGQKCSACSRVIVLAEGYQKFVERLVEAANSLSIGTAEDPANFMGPVVNEAAQTKIARYVELAAEEGTIVLQKKGPDSQGYYVDMTIVVDIEPTDRLANEEIFGPVLAVIKAQDFDQAIAIANRTPYALTGGVFSRSPGHLAQAREQMRVGNLYLNRGITGALVYRQPFGGFGLSGVGSKAGGPDYLLQFMDPVVVTENTMRRGFAVVD